MQTSFETLTVSLRDGIAFVNLNRPAKANAANPRMWEEIPLALEAVCACDEDIRVVVLGGEGKHFCAGIDLGASGEGGPIAAMAGGGSCPARQRVRLLNGIRALQESVSSLERCPLPVIAAIHGACVGGAIDIVTAADIRIASADAYFSVKEVDLAITADLGTLQRLPGIIGEGRARELSLTGRRFDAEEARAMGLVTALAPTRAALLAEAEKLALSLAAKSPLAVQGTKKVSLHSRDRSVADGLEHVATLNAAILMSKDLQTAMGVARNAPAPTFSRL
mmetsp:Transcript_22833/g.74376  ORF Transcript_22833/g.74376 Transcript_22833/m.74376 type:complete len:279 (+) Transcript_22833:66-902(+)